MPPCAYAHGSVPTVAFGFKWRAPFPIHVGFFDDVVAGTAHAPWLWWALALVVIVGLLLIGLKVLGLFPE